MKKLLLSLVFFASFASADVLDLGPVYAGPDGGPDGSFAGQTLNPQGPVVRIKHPVTNKWFHFGVYSSGALIEHKGTIEHWADDHSFHNHNQGGVFPWGLGARVWIGNPTDSGGGMLTALQDCAMDGLEIVCVNPRFQLIAQKFSGASHGNMQFVVRDNADGFDFLKGALGSEVPIARIDSTGIVVNGLNHSAKIVELQNRIIVLEGVLQAMKAALAPL